MLRESYLQTLFSLLLISDGSFTHLLIYQIDTSTSTCLALVYFFLCFLVCGQI